MAAVHDVVICAGGIRKLGRKAYELHSLLGYDRPNEFQVFGQIRVCNRNVEFVHDASILANLGCMTVDLACIRLRQHNDYNVKSSHIVPQRFKRRSLRLIDRSRKLNHAIT